MKKCLLLVLIALFICSAFQSSAAKLYGLTANNEIFVVPDAQYPSMISGPYFINGVRTGQTLVAIDFGAEDGHLYALGYNTETDESQLYRITGSETNFTAIPMVANNNSIDERDNINVAFSFNSYNYGEAVNGSIVQPIDIATDMPGISTMVRITYPVQYNRLYLYPNPVRSQARIVLSNRSQSNVYVDVIDLRGQRIRSFNFAPDSYLLDLDMSNIPEGFYNLRIMEKGKAIQSIKMLKQDYN
jgi:hypothetical protein